MQYCKPLPKINSDNATFWKRCKNHELTFQKCIACDHVRWPAAIICPNCLSPKTEHLISKGYGVIYTYAVYHVVYHPAFSNDIPYITAIVKLDEGPHLLTNIVKCPPEKMACGMRVEVVWEEVTPEVTLPKFKPI